MKRLLTGLVWAAALGGFTLAASADTTPLPADVGDAKGSFTAALEEGYDRGWWQGYGDGDFKPGRHISAEEWALVLGRVFPNGVSRVDAALFVSGGRAATPQDFTLGLPVDDLSRRYDRRRDYPWSLPKLTCPGDWAFYAETIAPPDRCGGSYDRDHFVPVKEADRSGAARWPDALRKQFFLDTDNLYLLTSRENEMKSDRDPAEWKPIRVEAHCEYARKWISVKVEYGLTADTAEVAELWNMLATCPE